MKHNFIVSLAILMIFNNESNYCSASDGQEPDIRINTDERQDSSHEEGFSNPGSSHVSTRLTLGPPGSDHYRDSLREDIQTSRQSQQSTPLTLATPGTSLSDDYEQLSEPESYRKHALQSGLSEREARSFEYFIYNHSIKLKTKGDLRNALYLFDLKLRKSLRQKEISESGVGSFSDSRKPRKLR